MSLLGTSRQRFGFTDLKGAPTHVGIFSMTADWDVVNGFSRRAGGILQDSGIYCLNPPKNDDCPIGICPNPDVDGPLVRIACEFSFSFVL